MPQLNKYNNKYKCSREYLATIFIVIIITKAQCCSNKKLDSKIDCSIVLKNNKLMSLIYYFYFTINSTSIIFV